MEYISSREELRSIYRTPDSADVAVRKELGRLDGHCRSFIERSPFVLIGSSDGDGSADVTPRGDRPGFVTVLDESTIAIPDRPGNNRLDTLENIVANPAVGLLFLIPGMNETLRVNGEAKVTVDAALCERMAVKGRPAISVLVINVRAAYLHCAKAFMRSQLWRPDTWPDRGALPTLGQMFSDQLAVDDSPEQTDRHLDRAYKETLW
ncbi:pyridoxamine 5'-phosphate oxidase family protein [Glycomyces salinus]|uniref:pyridoxamine 5'-phosphate oxidase family protein n=1 Tax=Glycomyces salinus TaxID=980294 RepID=UPI0018ECE913|nr:pyridoxamine 5'-phosphate oxidase family protein [Glycomyces salinus]